MRVLALVLVAAATAAHADWETGLVPEGSSTATIERHAVRLNVVGKSAVGLTDRLELSSYLPLIITPNIGLKYRLLDGPVSFALEGDLAVGGFPLAAAGLLPLPGIIAGGAGAGVALGSIQFAEAHLGFHPIKPLTLSLRGGGFAMEGTFLGVGVGGAVGGGGAAVVPAALAIGNTAIGYSAGAEIDLVLDPRNAFVVQGDVAGLSRGGPMLVLASASWIHAWDHFHLQLGVYNVVGVPMQKPPALPVAPFINVFWTFNRSPR